MTLPAVLGGPPAFSDRLRFARPLTPPLDDIVKRLRPSYEAVTFFTFAFPYAIPSSTQRQYGR